jgi:hypothetical protein
MFMITF